MFWTFLDYEITELRVKNQECLFLEQNIMISTKERGFYFPVTLSSPNSAYRRYMAMITLHLRWISTPLSLTDLQSVDYSKFWKDIRLHNHHLAIWIFQQRYFGQWIILLLRLSRFMNKYHQGFLSAEKSDLYLLYELNESVWPS